MKNILCFLAILVALISCTNKEKYYGEWVMTFPYSDNLNGIERITINQDSITISSFPHFKKYSEPLKLNSNNIELFNEIFNLRIENDSLLHFNNSTYIKKGYYTYDYEIYNNLVTVDYPKIENMDTVSHKSYAYAFFGKKLNSNEFGLQLNDRINSFKDLRMFLSPGHYSGIIDLSLTADKNTKMGDVNEIFYYCKSVNVRKLKLVNDTNYYVNDKNHILTTEEGVFISLSYLAEENLIGKEDEPPRILIPSSNSLKTIINSSNYHIISLINNEIYFDAKRASITDLVIVLLEKYVTENHFIVLYDDNSTFKHYLELMNAINYSFKRIRNKESLTIFKKPFDSLAKDERREMVMKIPKNLINGISFEDFKKLNIKIPELELVN